MTIKLELNITVRDKPFMSDTAILHWIMRRLDTNQLNQPVTVESIKMIGPRK